MLDAFKDLLCSKLYYAGIIGLGLLQNGSTVALKPTDKTVGHI